jgi:cytochrome c556
VAAAETKDPPKAAAGGEAVSLKDLIDKDALKSEINNVRNYLAGKAGSVAAYNASYLEIGPESATLAVLAVAVQKHPEEFSWKKNAKFVRELSSQITEMTTSEKAKNKNTYDAVAAAFEKIDEILKGSTPAGLPDAADEKDYGEAANDLRHIMKRIQRSEATLKTTVSNEAALKKDADKVAQEGAVLQFLGYAITADGFGWGDDAGFHKQAKPLQEGGKQIIEAAKSGNYPMYDEAMGRISKTCVECHGEFKNN